MQQERLTEEQEEAYHQELPAMQQEKHAENQKENNSSEEDQLSRDWVLDNFRLRDNPIIKENPEVRDELIQILQWNGQAFEGDALWDPVIVKQQSDKQTDKLSAEVNT